MHKIVLALLAIAVIHAQEHAQAFEAATLKPTDPNIHIVDRRITAERFSSINQTLEDYMRDAYGVRYDQIVGGPSWLREATFSIEATAGHAVSHDQMMAMLRTLLEDRFKLKIRREMKDSTVYVLTRGKGDHKLKPPANENARPMVFVNRNTPNNLPGVSYTDVGQNATVAQLIEKLSAIVHSTVTDKTGITGSYDFKFDYRPLNLPPDGPTDTGPSIFDSVPSQLGLKLEAQKGQLEVLVIEHAEQPTM